MKPLKIYRLLFLISIAAIIVGALFRIQHWPFGMIISFTGFIVFTVFSFLFYYSKSEKSTWDKSFMLLLPAFGVVSLLKFTDVSRQLQGNLTTILIFLGLGYFLFQSYQWLRQDRENGKVKFNFQRTTYVVGILLLGVGFLLKMYRFPYAGTTIIAGILVAIVAAFSESFIRNDDGEDEE